MDDFETLEVQEEETVLEETGAEDQEVAEPESGKNDADAAFAELRRENEALHRRLYEQETANKANEEALGRFFEGEDKALKAIAYAEGKSLEQVRQEQSERTELENLKRENETLRASQQKAAIELAMERDLKVIQKLDPNIKSLDELGDTFVRLIASGAGAEDAYYASIAKKEKETKSPANPPGKVGQSAAKKDFFTKEEVSQMSQEEVHKHYDTIRKSMPRW